MRVIGIDPGKAGAMALLEKTTGDAFSVLLDAIDIPLIGLPFEEVDVLEIIRWIRESKAQHCFIERVHGTVKRPGSSHGMGVSGAFNFGAAFGAIKACIIGCCVPMTLISPHVWKKSYSLTGVSADKDAKEKARQLALQYYPGAADILRRKKDHNRAESALIARYGLEMKIGNGIGI